MGSIDYGLGERPRSAFGEVVDAVVARLHASGRSAEVRGPGLEWDEWQLVVDGVVMASGYSYGSFEKSVVAFQQRSS